MDGFCLFISSCLLYKAKSNSLFMHSMNLITVTPGSSSLAYFVRCVFLKSYTVEIPAPKKAWLLCNMYIKKQNAIILNHVYVQWFQKVLLRPCSYILCVIMCLTKWWTCYQLACLPVECFKNRCFPELIQYLFQILLLASHSEYACVPKKLMRKQH